MVYLCRSNQLNAAMSLWSSTSSSLILSRRNRKKTSPLPYVFRMGNTNKSLSLSPRSAFRSMYISHRATNINDNHLFICIYTYIHTSRCRVMISVPCRRFFCFFLCWLVFLYLSNVFCLSAQNSDWCLYEAAMRSVAPVDLAAKRRSWKHCRIFKYPDC